MTSTDNRRSSFALKYLATTIAATSAETGERYILNESPSSGGPVFDDCSNVSIGYYKDQTTTTEPTW